jgi:hypothetical protein
MSRSLWIDMLRGASQAARSVRDQDAARRKPRREAEARTTPPESRPQAQEPAEHQPGESTPASTPAQARRHSAAPAPEPGLRIPPPTPPACLRPHITAPVPVARTQHADVPARAAAHPVLSPPERVEASPAEEEDEQLSDNDDTEVEGEAPDPATNLDEAPELAAAPESREVPLPRTCGHGPTELREVVMLAVAEAVEAVEARRVRSALHVLVTAQEEHAAMMLAAVQQVREECNATMTRLADRLTDAVERLAGAFEGYTDTAIPAALADVGEQVRVSTGEIAGTLRAIVAQNARVTAALDTSRERDERLTNILERIHTAIEGAGEPPTAPDGEEQAESPVLQPVARDPQEATLYERIADVMHDDEDEEADHVH